MGDGQMDLEELVDTVWWYAKVRLLSDPSTRRTFRTRFAQVFSPVPLPTSLNLFLLTLILRIVSLRWFIQEGARQEAVFQRRESQRMFPSGVPAGFASHTSVFPNFSNKH